MKVLKSHICLILLIYISGFRGHCQSINLGPELYTTCVDSLKTVTANITGEFGANNQFFIEFYSVDGANRLLHSQAIQVIDGKISFTYPYSVYQYYKYAIIEIRSTNPSANHYIGGYGIHSKPIYSFQNENKISIESGIYNKSDIVELPFRIYTGTNVLIETTSGKTFLSEGGGDTYIYSYREVLNSSGFYGVRRVSNFCGTTNQMVGYNLKVNSPRFKIRKTEQTEYVCNGNKFVIDLQSDSTLPESGLNFLVSLSNAQEQATELTYTRNKQQLIIDIPEYVQAGEYKVKVRVLEMDLVAATNINIKETPIYSVSGTYDVKYGESFLITSFNAPVQNNFNYENLDLFLNAKIKLHVNAQAQLKYNFPTTSGMYYLTGAFSTDLLTSCKNRVTGGIQVNVKPSIRIESISSETLCRGQDFILELSSNQELLPTYNYKVRLGKFVSTEEFSNRKVYYDTYQEISAIWLSSKTIKFSVPLNSSLNTKPDYFISIVVENPSIEGIIYPNPIRILEAPNVNFVNTTYNIYPTTYLANYTTNSHIGQIQMSDGKVYSMEQNYETWQDNDGHIRSLAYQSAYHYPVKAWNQCGLGSVSGGYYVNNTEPSRTAVLLAPLRKKSYCIGDTIWIDWSKNGVFNANNRFFLEFSESNFSNIEISANQKFIISNISSAVNSPSIRVKSTSPETFSVWRDLGIKDNPILANIAMKNVQYGAYNASFDTVTVNAYSPVVFYGHGGEFRTASNQIIPLDRPILFTKDTVIRIAQVSNSCVTQSFNKNLKINFRPYLCNVSDFQVSCNKNKTLIRLKYYFYGDHESPIKLAVQFKNHTNGIWTTLPTNAPFNDEVWAELNSDNVNDTYCYIRLVRVNQQNQVLDVLSRNYTVIIKKYVQNYRLTSVLGNNVVANSYPFPLTLTTTPNEPFFYYSFYNPYGLINQEMSLYKDQSFSVLTAYSDCGYVNVSDSVKVKFIPQLINVTIQSSPCKGPQSPLSFSYEILNRFPSGTTLKFYISNTSGKFYIGQTGELNGWFSAVIPSIVPLGIYNLGYESIDGNYSKNISIFDYGDTGKVRLIGGTINKYIDDPFYVPFELKDGYNYYKIELNISEYVSYPVYEYRKITINEDGYKLGSLVSSQTPSNVFINSVETNTSVCGSEISPDTLKVNYLNGYSNKIYANIDLNNNNLPIKCVGNETLPVILNSQGYFNPTNQFFPQLSDSLGLNFADIDFTRNGNTYMVKLPENLPTGEGYRMRFRSTSPIVLGASSIVNIIVKPRPNVNLSGAYIINEGESVSLNAPLKGEKPFNIILNNGVEIADLQANRLQMVLTPLQDFNYSVSSIRDKFCVGNSTGSLNVKINCSQTKQLSLTHTENRVYKSFSLKSNAIITPNINIRYRGGKSILLEPGFKVEKNATFIAEMGGCN